jgi:hypothetical protein
VPRLTVRWSWLGWVVLFFAWSFVIHGMGVVLHEVGGHGLAATIVACGFDGLKLTYFGRASVQFTPCTHWTETRRMIVDLAGIAVMSSAGAVAMMLQRRAGLTPLVRLLLALLATQFLLGDLGYATSGGYFEVMDPHLTAVVLESHGLHVLAWLPPLVLYATAATYGARAIVGAFREHFGSRSRLHALKQSTATLGAAWLLFYAARSIEAAIRTDTIPSVAVEAEKRAAFFRGAPWRVHRFPIQYVLVGIAVAAFVLALARPVVPGDGGQDTALPSVPRRHAAGVAVAALGCVITITLLVRV